MTLFWAVSIATFMAISFAPNRWFIDRSRYSQQEAARITVHNAAYGSKATTVERSRVQQEAKLAITNNDVGGHDGKEAARVKAHNAAYGSKATTVERSRVQQEAKLAVTHNDVTPNPPNGHGWTA